jgi:translocation protein SEC66
VLILTIPGKRPFQQLDEIQAQTESEKEWWEKRRDSIKKEFLKEIESEGLSTPAKTQTSKVSSDDDAILVDNPVSTDKGSIRKKGKK